MKNIFAKSLLVATLLGWQAPVSAIVINDGAGAAASQALGAAQTSVVQILIGGGLCSGTLIDSTHVLTAQHCTFGSAAGIMTVNFDTNGDGMPDTPVGVSAKAEPDGTNVLLDGTDLAILTLAAAAPFGIVPVTLLDALPAAGMMVDMFGYGLNGLGSTGHGGTLDGFIWGAENLLHSYGAALAPGGGPIGGSMNIINTDFDDGTPGANTLPGSMVPKPNEGTTAPGDSGGPLLWNGFLLGVLSGGTTATSTYGDISWWTGALPFKDLILATAPDAQFGLPVPAPSVLVLLLSGLVVLVGMRRQQAARQAR